MATSATDLPANYSELNSSSVVALVNDAAASLNGLPPAYGGAVSLSSSSSPQLSERRASRATLMRALEWAAASADEPRPLLEAAADVVAVPLEVDDDAAGAACRLAAAAIDDVLAAAQPQALASAAAAAPSSPADAEAVLAESAAVLSHALTAAPFAAGADVASAAGRLAAAPRAVAAPSIAVAPAPDRSRASASLATAGHSASVRVPPSAPVAAVGLAVYAHDVHANSSAALPARAARESAATLAAARAAGGVVDNVSFGATFGAASLQLLEPFADAPWLLRPSPQRALMAAAGGEASSRRLFLQDHETFLQLASAVSSLIYAPGAPDGDGDDDADDVAEVTLTTRLPAAGGAACEVDSECYSGSLRALLDAEGSGDVALDGSIWSGAGNVCCRGACVCAPGFVGSRCEILTRCERWEGAAQVWNASACTTLPSEAQGGDTQCVCDLSTPGALDGSLDVAVTLRWELRWLPTSNLVRVSAAEATQRVADYLRDSPVGGLLLGGLLGAYALLAIVAVVYDARVLYIRYPPEWVARCTQGRRAAQSPARFDGRSGAGAAISPGVKPKWHWTWRFVFHLRMRHAVLRCFSVVPGHTPTTRLQLLTVLFNQLLLILVFVLVWYDRPQCYTEQLVVAALVSALVSFGGSTACRLLLRAAYRATFWGRPSAENWRKIRRGSLQPHIHAAEKLHDVEVRISTTLGDMNTNARKTFTRLTSDFTHGGSLHLHSLTERTRESLHLRDISRTSRRSRPEKDTPRSNMNSTHATASTSTPRSDPACTPRATPRSTPTSPEPSRSREPSRYSRQSRPADRYSAGAEAPAAAEGCNDSVALESLTLSTLPLSTQPPPPALNDVHDFHQLSQIAESITSSTGSRAPPRTPQPPKTPLPPIISGQLSEVEMPSGSRGAQVREATAEISSAAADAMADAFGGFGGGPSRLSSPPSSIASPEEAPAPAPAADETEPEISARARRRSRQESRTSGTITDAGELRPSAENVERCRASRLISNGDSAHSAPGAASSHRQSSNSSCADIEHVVFPEFNARDSSDLAGAQQLAQSQLAESSQLGELPGVGTSKKGKSPARRSLEEWMLDFRAMLRSPVTAPPPPPGAPPSDRLSMPPPSGMPPGARPARIRLSRLRAPPPPVRTSPGKFSPTREAVKRRVGSIISGAPVDVQVAPSLLHRDPDTQQLGLVVAGAPPTFVAAHRIERRLLNWSLLVVTVDGAEIPRAKDGDELRAPELVRPLHQGRRCGDADLYGRAALAIAWVLSLFVFLFSVGFILYAAALTESVGKSYAGTVAQAGVQDAGCLAPSAGCASSFAGAVGRAYALSITLAFVVKDPIVAALVALAPVRSTRAVRVFNAVASVLSLFF